MNGLLYDICDIILTYIEFCIDEYILYDSVFGFINDYLTSVSSSISEIGDVSKFMIFIINILFIN
jgi:hypothetical protein